MTQVDRSDYQIWGLGVLVRLIESFVVWDKNTLRDVLQTALVYECLRQSLGERGRVVKFCKKKSSNGGPASYQESP